jgi:hypothetical protein
VSTAQSPGEEVTERKKKAEIVEGWWKRWKGKGGRRWDHQVNDE